MAATNETRPGTEPHSRFPCFDGLRALAALSIVLTHVAFASGANSSSILGVFFARLVCWVEVFLVI